MTERGATATLTAPAVIAWRNAVFAIFGISGFVFASWASRVVAVRDLLHAQPAEMGVLLTALAVGAILGLLGSGSLVARLGATRTILWAYCVASAAVVLVGLATAVAPSLAVLVLPLAVFGAGSSTVDVAMNLSGAANERALGRAVMPLFHGVFSLGTVAGAGIGALMITLGVPTATHLVVVGLAAIAGTVVLVRFLQPAESGEAQAAGESTWRSRLASWRNPRVLLVGVIVLGMAFAEGSATDWLALAFVDGHGVTPAVGAAVFGIFVAAMTVGRIAGVRVLDRFGRVAVLRGSAVLAVVGLTTVILVPCVPVAVAGVVLWGLGAALGFPVGMSAAADDPRSATANVSVVATIGYLAFLVGPPAIGLLGQGIGVLSALVVVLVVIVLAGFASSAARPPTPAGATAGAAA